MDIQELKTKSDEEAHRQLFETENIEDLPEMKHTIIGDSSARIGILLQHGFCGSNLEMLFLGNYFAKQGYRVLIPLLPGHGQDSDALLKVTHQDWQIAVSNSIEYLKNETDGRKLFIIGHSLGGALALLSGDDPDILGIVSLAGPIQYPLYMRIPMNIFGFISLKVPFETFHFHDKRLYDHPGMKNFLNNYGKVGVKSLAEVFNLLKLTHNHLPNISKPTCLIYSQLDTTVPPYHARKIVQRIGTVDLELHWLSKSYHIMVVDDDRDLVAQKILSFMDRIISSYDL